MLTLIQAAESLGLSVNTLRVQARLGRFRAEKLGRDWFVTAEEVERYRRESKRSTVVIAPFHKPVTEEQSA